MFEDHHDRPAPAPLRIRPFAAHAVLFAGLTACWFQLGQEPFWCLRAQEVLVLLVAPGLLAGAWATVVIAGLQGAREKHRRMRSLLSVVLSVLGMCAAAVAPAAYLEDLSRSPSLSCGELPDYGACAEHR